MIITKINQFMACLKAVFKKGALQIQSKKAHNAQYGRVSLRNMYGHCGDAPVLGTSACNGWLLTSIWLHAQRCMRKL
jgi:hypothetical protein